MGALRGASETRDPESKGRVLLVPTTTVGVSTLTPGDRIMVAKRGDATRAELCTFMGVNDSDAVLIPDNRDLPA
jgi:hypothetical protein